MREILQKNIKEYLQKIEFPEQFKDDEFLEININLIAYVKLYFQKIGKDKFIENTLENTKYAFLLESSEHD